MLASGVEYTDVVIRRHLYPQTMLRRPPFVMGYNLVGEIDQRGDGVSGFQVGNRVADMTVVGSNAAYRARRARRAGPRAGCHADRIPARRLHWCRAGSTSSSTASARTAIAARSPRSSAMACSAPLRLHSERASAARLLNFELLATRAIRPRVAERISFDEVAEAHRRLQAGGLDGKLVLCPDLPSPGHWPPAQRATASVRLCGRLRRGHSIASYRRAAHVARLALVEAADAMHGLAVIPDDEVVLPPHVRIDKLALRCVLRQIANEVACFRHRPTDDGADMR